MKTQAGSTYVIPLLEAKGVGKIFLLIPTTIALFALIGYWFSGENGAFYGIVAGLPSGIVLTVFFGVVFSVLHTNRLKGIWETHTFRWYREKFPEHAHANGHVSCRHCTSHRVHASKLMNRTFMRAHSCAQCGETLYYSKEA
jgi:hypothetical protein